MKLIITTSILVLGLVSSCTSAGQKSQMKEEFNEITGQTNTNWSERKTQFLRRSENKLNEISTDLNKMKKHHMNPKMRHSSDAMNNLNKSKKYLEDVREELADLKKVDASDWQDEKRDFVTSLNILENQFEKTRSFFN